MEATQVNVSNVFEDGAVGLGDRLIEASPAVGPNAAPSFEFHSDLTVGSFQNKKQSNSGDQQLQESSVHLGTSCDPRLQVPASTPGVSNCYVFKSRLQEYAQKVGFPTPLYETIKEGPSHEPSFRSTVIVGGARYDSLPGFFNRKAAEQSAAEVALVELCKSGDSTDSIAAPVHETGLCKNLLQEYAQKMNYAIPTYICRKDDAPGRMSLFSCTVEIGGIQYIGATSRTKKEAEIKAARTALLAIRSSGIVEGPNADGKPQYTVVPGKRKMSEVAPLKVESAKVKKKKPRFKKLQKRMQHHNSGHKSQAGIIGVLVSNDIDSTAIQQFENGFLDVQVPNNGQQLDYMTSSDLGNRPLKSNQQNKECQTLVTSSSCQPDDHGNTYSVESAGPVAHMSRNHAASEEKNDQGVDKVAPVINAPLSKHLVALPTDSGISHEDPATAVADKNIPSD